MRTMFFCLLSAVFVFTVQPVTAAQSDRVLWEKRPVSIVLDVDAETTLTFPTPVEVRYPRSLTDVVRVESLGARVFVKVDAAFDSTRVYAQALDGNGYYIIDLSGTDSNDGPREIFIVDEQRGAAPDAESGTADGVAGDGAERGSESGATVALIRHMAPTFYGPGRLKPTLPGASRIAVPKGPIELLRTRNVVAIPEAGWRYRGIYGYAVRLVNLSASEYVVDPREFVGRWRTATPQHSLLTAANSTTAPTRFTNETMVYLTTDRPIAESVSMAGETP